MQVLYTPSACAHALALNLAGHTRECGRGRHILFHYGRCDCCRDLDGVVTSGSSGRIYELLDLPPPPPPHPPAVPPMSLPPFSPATAVVADAAELRAALSAVAAGDELRISLRPGARIALHGEPIVVPGGMRLTLEGQYAPDAAPAVIDAERRSRAFEVIDAELTLRGLRITGVLKAP